MNSGVYIGRQVTARLRKDDIDFYQRLLQEGAEHLTPGAAKKFWAVIRRSLPKFKQRKACIHPFAMEALTEEWIPYFAELEAGQVTAPLQLVKLDSAPVATDCDAEVTLQQIPTINELEDTFRATRPGKASGHDPLPTDIFHRFPKQLAELHMDMVVKMFLWNAEPCQHKGGQLAVLPKRVQANQPMHFRGDAPPHGFEAHPRID